jgi:hypothetical protein
VKKNIVFMFSEKIGFKAYCDKKYYWVKFPGILNKDKKSHIPQVTKRLIHDTFCQRENPGTCGRLGGLGVSYRLYTNMIDKNAN